MKKKLVDLFLLAALLLSACAAPAPAAPTAPTGTKEASMPGMDAQNGCGKPGISFQVIGSTYCGSSMAGS